MDELELKLIEEIQEEDLNNQQMMYDEIFKNSKKGEKV
jgi:hypothetical protein